MPQENSELEEVAGKRTDYGRLGFQAVFIADDSAAS
jgi:hypothetical protein